MPRLCLLIVFVAACRPASPTPSFESSPPSPGSEMVAAGAELVAPPLLVGDRFVAPADWKTLPTAASLWQRTDLRQHDLLAVEGGLVASHDRSLVLLDAATGDVRWRADIPSPQPLAFCEDTVAVHDPRGRLIGLDLRTGEERWRRELALADGEGHLRHTAYRQLGCSLVLGLDSSGRSVSWRLDALIAVDLATGAERELGRCPGCVLERFPSRDGVVLTHGERSLFVGLDGTRRSLSEGVSLVAGNNGTIQVNTGEEIVGEREWHVLADGRERWRGPGLRLVLGRVEDDVIGVREDSLVRMDLTDGTERWALRMSAELLPRFGEISGEKLTWGINGPWLIATVDLSTGTPHSLRVAPRYPSRVRVAGSTLYATDCSGTSAVPLTGEDPPLRSRLSLRADIERSIRVLAGDEVPASCQTPLDLDEHPQTPGRARAWLGRLGALAIPSLTNVIQDGSLAEATRVVLALALMEEPFAAPPLALALERTLTRPDSDARDLRRAAARAFPHASLDDRLASALARSAVSWLQAAGSLRCDYSEPDNACMEQARIMDAVVATRDLLERASIRAAPLHRLRDALADTHSAASCPADDDDDARRAVLRHLAEFGSPVPIVAEGLQCSTVIGVDGPLTALDAPIDDFSIEIGPSSPAEGEGPTWSDGPWNEAPRRLVRLGGANDAWRDLGHDVVVVKVDGLWRTIVRRQSWLLW